MERVVVTGIGIISAIGMGKTEFWENAVKGTSGVSAVEKFDTRGYGTNLGGEIKSFAPYIKNLDPALLGGCARYAASAARMAYDDAKADRLADMPENASVFMGTTMGEGTELKKVVRGFMENEKINESIFKFPAHNISAAVCKELNVRSGAVLISNACAAGNSALINAYEQIKNGRIKYAFAGGADIFSESAYIGFSKLRSLAKDRCSPFDKNRQGMVIGEGAGVLFLESRSSAKTRGAEIYAEIIGWGAGCDAYRMAAPRPDAGGIKRAMREALETSGVSIGDVDYICAHGTGTRANDRAEAIAINEIFGRKVPVSSIKSMIGHAMGAASAIEAGACCMAVKEGVIPPTINYSERDEACDIDCVPNKARRQRVRIAANNAYAFGGNNTCVLFKEAF